MQHLRVRNLNCIEMTRKTGDITKRQTWKNVQSASVVYHLAGKSFVPHSWEEPAEFIHVNVKGTQQALEYCRGHDAKLVFISAYVYGIPEKLPISEADSIQPNNPYALSKYLAEQVCQFYSANYDVPITIVRPFNVYGPGQREEFVIPEIIHQVKSENEIRVKSLSPKRDYIYVDDIVSGLSKAADYDEMFSVFNLGSGQSYSVQELIAIAQGCAGTELTVFSDNAVRINEVDEVRADISHAFKNLSWEPKVSIQKGLRRLLDLEQKYE